MARRAPWWPPRFSNLFRGAPDRQEEPMELRMTTSFEATQLANQLTNQVSVQMARELEQRLAAECTAPNYSDYLLSYEFENLRSNAHDSTVLRVRVISHHFGFNENFSITLSRAVEIQLRSFWPVFRLVAVHLESTLRPFINRLRACNTSRAGGQMRLREYWRSNVEPLLLRYTQRLVVELVVPTPMRSEWRFDQPIEVAKQFKASKKAQELLVRCLSPVQRKEYELSNSFSVYLPKPIIVRTELSYRQHEMAGYYFITARHNFNVHGPELMYCTQLEGCNIIPDNMLAQKLLLEQCPEEFFRVANRSSLTNSALYNSLLRARERMNL